MAAATKKEGTIAEKLDALFELQKIDSEIDRIRTIRGELPLEVQSLEDEIIANMERWRWLPRDMGDDRIEELEAKVARLQLRCGNYEDDIYTLQQELKAVTP